MQVSLNGAAQTLEEGTSLAAFLEAAGTPRQGVAVEVNQHLVRREDFAQRVLQAGDRIEVVGLVGGG